MNKKFHFTNKNFIYPLDIQTPNVNVDTFDFAMLLPWNWFRPKNDVWCEPLLKVLKHLQTNILVENKQGEYILPEGTKLYHSSLNEHVRFTADRLTFFGIDVVISIWYLLEMVIQYQEYTDSPYNSNIGYLYEFVTTKPIKVSLLQRISDHPKDGNKCKGNVVCIHPQLSYHGDTDAPPPYELCIEVSMNVKYHQDDIRLNKKYTADLSELEKNKRKSLKEFDPVFTLKEINI